MSCREDWSSKKHSKCWDHKGDECWKEFKECKKDHKEKCDCCCTTGIFQTLRALRGRAVIIGVRGLAGIITGTVVSVNCDVVTLTVEENATLTLSICDIFAVLAVPPATVSQIPEELLNIFKG